MDQRKRSRKEEWTSSRNRSGCFMWIAEQAQPIVSRRRVGPSRSPSGEVCSPRRSVTCQAGFVFSGQSPRLQPLLTSSATPSVDPPECPRLSQRKADFSHSTWLSWTRRSAQVTSEAHQELSSRVARRHKRTLQGVVR